MIRARREQDLDRLCATLQALGHPSSGWSAAALRGWLTEHRTEQSWVFDQAPVTVAPTSNVVGHVEIFVPVAASSLAAGCPWPLRDVLAIGKLFVQPQSHQHGIARYLLKEAVRYIRGQDKQPVADLASSAVAQAFFEKYGFEQVPTADPGLTLLAHSDSPPRAAR